MDNGLDDKGHIRREGSLDRIAPAFTDLIADLRARVTTAFDDRLDGLYLYGSIPRGTARIGSSDLDAMAVLNSPHSSDDDRTTLDAIMATLDRTHEVVDGGGILVATRDQLLSPEDRYDGGFFTACLCTPLYGEDLATLLPSYEPSVRLARDTNGNIADQLRARRELLVRTSDPAEVTKQSRFARKLVRTAFTLVMPRWQGWTSDFDVIEEVFGSYYPERRSGLRHAIELGRDPSDDPADVAALLDGFGAWLASEYAVVIGLK